MHITKEHFEKIVRNTVIGLIVSYPLLHILLALIHSPITASSIPVSAMVLDSTMLSILSILITYGVWQGHIILRRSWILTAIPCWIGARVISAFFSALPARALIGSAAATTDTIVFALLCASVWILISQQKNLFRPTLLALVWQSFFITLVTFIEAAASGFFTHIVRPTSPLFNTDFYIAATILIYPIGVAFLVLAFKEKRSALIKIGLALYLSLATLCLFTCLPPDLQNHVRLYSKQAETKSVNEFLNNDSNNERFTQWRLSYETFKEHPATGIGTSALDASFFQHTKDLSNWNYRFAMYRSHSDFIEQWAQYGVLGGFAYLFLLSTIGVLLFKKIRAARESEKLLLIAAALGIALLMLFNQVLFTTEVSALGMWLILGATLTSTEKKKEGLNSLLTLVSLCAVLAVIFTANFLALRRNTAEQSLNKAYFAYGKNDHKLAAQYARRAAEVSSNDPYYLHQAAIYTTNYAMSIEPGEKRSVILKSAKTYAHTATLYDPYSPFSYLAEEIANYLLVPVEEEDAALQGVIETYKRMPWNPNFPQKTLDAIAAKNSVNKVQHAALVRAAVPEKVQAKLFDRF